MSLALLSECYLQNFKKLKKRNKKTIQKSKQKNNATEILSKEAIYF